MPEISVRPLKPDDIPKIIKYWQECTDEDFLRIGIDKSKIRAKGKYDELCQHFLESCETSLEVTKSFYMVWCIDGESVGHNALKNILRNEIADMHLHMWNTKFRGQGLGPKLFCMAAIEFYKLFNLKMILCEPSSQNPMPNKMLNKIGYKLWKTYISNSSDLTFATELNSYVVDKEISISFLANSEL